MIFWWARCDDTLNLSGDSLQKRFRAETATLGSVGPLFSAGSLFPTRDGIRLQSLSAATGDAGYVAVERQVSAGNTCEHPIDV